MSRRDRDAAAGFTLLEVVVAFIVLGLVLAATFDVFSTGARNAIAADGHTRAVVLAESRLASLGVLDPVVAGASAGRFDDEYSWRLDIRPAWPDRAEESGATQLYAVDVTVSWGPERRRNAVTLSTYRTRWQ